ncbi:hypothetical protein GCM10020295_08530 [Streptomyces cinereospinus]
MVIDGEAAWLYDAEQERWVYCDGTRIDTYAVSSVPSAGGTPAAPAPPRASDEPLAPTRIVDWPGEPR